MPTSTFPTSPPAPAGLAKAAGRLVVGVGGQARRTPRAGLFPKMIGLLEDAVLLMLAVLLIPFLILLVGAPIALGLRAVIEIVHRVL